ncbi:unnamed protein product, partial [Brenthis ino]
MTSFENLSISQKVRAALHRDVRAICVETCHCMGLDITKPANAIIAELVISKIALYGSDLEAFAKHAKRSTINSDDVKLLVRRNPALKARLIKLCGDNAPKEKRRKTTAPLVRTEAPIQKKLELDIKKKVVEEMPGPSKESDEFEDNMIDLTLSQ